MDLIIDGLIVFVFGSLFVFFWGLRIWFEYANPKRYKVLGLILVNKLISYKDVLDFLCFYVLWEEFVLDFYFLVLKTGEVDI